MTMLVGKIPPEDPRLAELAAFIDANNTRPHPESHLIATLHRAQELFGYLDRNVLDMVALRMNVPTAHIWGVATFYHYFNLAPRGRHVISVCLGTACFIKGADRILDTLKEELKIDVGGTTEDGLFSLAGARCLGACGLAPVVMIDDRIHGDLTPKKTIEIINGLRREAERSTGAARGAR